MSSPTLLDVAQAELGRVRMGRTYWATHVISAELFGWKVDMPTLYSRAYMLPDNLVGDSARLRIRLTAVLQNYAVDWRQLGVAVRERTGAPAPIYTYGQHLLSWLERCPVRDILDFVTIAAEHIAANRRADFIRRAQTLFSEEGMAYEVADDGSIRPKVDNEFAATVVSAIRGLEDQRHAGVRHEFELGQAALTPINPDWSRATYHTFRANEVLFKLVDPTQPRLVADKVEQVYLPLVNAAYAGNQHLIHEARSALRGYRDWIDAAHFERHAPGSEQPHDMPQSLGALMVSQGAGFLRWLLDLDAARGARG